MSTRTVLQYAGMAFAAAMVMGIPVEEVASPMGSARIAPAPPAVSPSALPLAPAARPASPAPSLPPQQPTPSEEAMERQLPLARGVVQA